MRYSSQRFAALILTLLMGVTLFTGAGVMAQSEGQAQATPVIPESTVAPVPTSAPSSPEAPNEGVSTMACPISRLTLNMSSSDPSVTQIGPNSTFRLTGATSTPLLYFRDSTALPQNFSTPWFYNLPCGSYTLTIDAGADFEPYSTTFDITTDTTSLPVVLTPKADPTAGYFTFTITSCAPEVDNQLPPGTRWEVRNSAGTVLDYGAGLPGFFPQRLSAPQFSNPAYPYGDYTLTITPPSEFAPFSQTFTLADSYSSPAICLYPLAVAPTPTVAPTATTVPTATTAPTATLEPTATVTVVPSATLQPSATTEPTATGTVIVSPTEVLPTATTETEPTSTVSVLPTETIPTQPAPTATAASRPPTSNPVPTKTPIVGSTIRNPRPTQQTAAKSTTSTGTSKSVTTSPVRALPKTGVGSEGQSTVIWLAGGTVLVLIVAIVIRARRRV